MLCPLHLLAAFKGSFRSEIPEKNYLFLCLLILDV